MTELRDLLQRAAPVGNEFDADALVDALALRTRRRRMGALATVVIFGAAAVTGALAFAPHR
jgi:hypothetical protein